MDEARNFARQEEVMSIASRGYYCIIHYCPNRLSMEFISREYPQNSFDRFLNAVRSIR